MANITEYKIDIDSVDRDIRYWPNPFQFNIKFGIPCSANGQFDILINQYFENIKYIRLENIILPQKISLCQNKNGGFQFDQTKLLYQDRFVYLYIKELESNKRFSSSDNSTRYGPDGQSYFVNKPFAILIPDKIYGSDFYTGSVQYSQLNFDNLKKIPQLSLVFYDSYGLPLNIPGLYNYDQLKQATADGNPILLTDPRHPLNKKIQIHLTLIFGISNI